MAGIAGLGRCKGLWQKFAAGRETGEPLMPVGFGRTDGGVCLLSWVSESVIEVLPVLCAHIIPQIPNNGLASQFTEPFDVTQGVPTQ